MFETELKFQVPPARRAAVRKAVATATAVTTRLQAVYADTAELSLAKAGLALRLRQEGHVWVQALKGRGDGLMQRLEHEVGLPPQAGIPALDPQRHAGTAVGDALLLALQGAGGLRPLYRTDIRRLHRPVRFGGATIEVAYDVGQIIAGEHKCAVNEIEFELLRGPAVALVELAARWATRHGLWWDVRTKSERGYRLALGMVRVPAVCAPPVNLPEDASSAQAWSLQVQSALAHALPNAAELAGATGADAHQQQLCAALRRLQGLLRAAPMGVDGDDLSSRVADWAALGQAEAAADPTLSVLLLRSLTLALA